LRKQIAAKDAVPAYMVFTDEELAALAKLSVITKQEMLKIKGIGDKKVEKYGEQMISALTK
jgi:superfamily II DNA helicase RecQ